MDIIAEQGNLETEIELARLAAIVASSNDAIVSKDLNGVVNSWNGAAERVFGYSATEMIGRHITTIIPPELQFEEAEIIGKIRSGERIEHYDTIRVRKDGGRINVSLTVSPLRNRVGQIVGASKIARDITERKRNEELQQILVNELNHRTRNLLSTVQAIAMRTFGTVEGARENIEIFRRRIGALTASQDLLTKNGWQGASVRTMLDAVLEPFIGDGARIDISVGPDLHLNLRQTNALAMAMHELATNATKYGALAADGGSIEVSWAVSGDDIVLDWRERDGPRVEPPARTGFGTRMIKQALEHELCARVDFDFDRSGVRFSVRFPLADVVKQARALGS